MDDIYENIDKYNQRNILAVFDDMIEIWDMLHNIKRHPLITDLFIRSKDITFLSQSTSLLYQRNIRLNSTHYFIMKIPNKQKLRKIAINDSSDIDLKDFMNLYKKFTLKSRSFLALHQIILLHCNLLERK